MKWMAAVMLLASLSSAPLLAQAPPQQKPAVDDRDSDGLADSLEQQLLEKFRPVFMLSGSECDVAPAEFSPASVEPIVAAKNRTIYGQVFPNSHGSAPLIEIHFYHLWSRDCARFGHALDAERVAVLVGATGDNSVDSYRALAWYTAAHEDTRCDGSSGAQAALLHAESRGAMVWVSSGKHASFLDKECNGSCGEDRCDNPSAMASGALINIGEPGRPLNGASWTSSPLWPLSLKMQPIFTESLVAQLSEAEGIVPVNDSSRAQKGVIRRAGMTANALQTGSDRTGNAIGRGSEKTNDAMSASYSGTKSSLRRAAGAVGRWFRGAKAKSAD